MNDDQQASTSENPDTASNPRSAGTRPMHPIGPPDEEVGDDGIVEVDAGDDSVLKDSPPATPRAPAPGQAKPTERPATPSAP